MKKLAISAIAVSLVAGAIYFFLRSGDGPIETESDGIVFEGDWDKERAFATVRRTLDETEWSSKEDFCSVPACIATHQVHGDFKLAPEGKETIVLAATSIEEGSDCHACGPYVSLFEFQSAPTGWKLTRSDPGVFRWGQWGQLGPDELHIVDVGIGKYAAMIDGGGTGQGVTVRRTVLYMRVGDDYHEVFNLQTGEHDASGFNDQATDWDSTVRLQNREGEVSDILVERKGLRDGERINERELYRFNGEVYESISTKSA